MLEKVALKKALLRYYILLLLSCYLIACQDSTDNLPGATESSAPDFAVEGINELLPGDIIVRPNTNLFPGTARVPSGFMFGHAAIVVRGFRSDNIDTLLANSIIIESMARDVQPGFQVREISALAHHGRDAFNNTNFSSKFTGNRYRLRLKWTEDELERLLAFLREQKGDLSTWNAAKRFPDTEFTNSLVQSGYRKSWADNSHWYCSLLVWQAVYYIKGIDLDPNGGYMVYPNDLITSPEFDNKPDHIGRARF
jgi:hypothetical protein